MTRIKRNYYHSVSLGEAFLKIKVLHRQFSVLNILKDNWNQIAQAVELLDRVYIDKFTRGKLFLSTKVPIIYITHLKEIIKSKCNQVLPSNMVTEIVFVKARLDTQ